MFEIHRKDRQGSQSFLKGDGVVSNEFGLGFILPKVHALIFLGVFSLLAMNKCEL